MGRATRWFKSLFGFTTPRRDKDVLHDSGRVPKDHDISSLLGNPPVIPPNISAAEAAWLRSFFTEKAHEDREQSRRAIAVAVASAAAADAAARAAVAAAAVARLTGCSRRGGGGGRREGSLGFSPKERSAAVKIQTMFRGFLARKALRALKGLVKLQALVRGFLVRKRATAALRGIQALMRVQDAARLRRSRRIPDNSSFNECDDRSCRTSERFGDQPTPIHSSRRTPPFDSSPRKDNPKIQEVDDLITRPKSSSSRRTTTSASMSESYHPVMSSPQTPQFSKSYDICYYNECYNTWDDDQLRRRPGYMAKTLSFRAKWRSQSAPRQRQKMLFEKHRDAREASRQFEMGRRDDTRGVLSSVV